MTTNHHRFMPLGLGLTLGVTLAALLPGCASPPRDAGFSQVQQTVTDRTGQTPQRRNVEANPSANDQALAAAIRDLLHHDLSPQQAIQVALLNNRRLQATFEDLGIARADLVQAGLLANPVFMIQARFPASPPSGTNIEVEVVEDFMSVLLMPMRKKIAAAEFEGAKHRVGQAALDLAAQVETAYYQLQAADQMVEMRRAAMEATHAGADAAKRIHEAGNSTELDYANQVALDQQARLDLAQAENEAVETREHLAVLMGLWGADVQFHLPAHLPAIPEAGVSPRGLESLAIAQREDLAAQRDQLTALARTLGLTRQSQILPFLDAGIDAERDPDGQRQWLVGPNLQVPIPIFDTGKAAESRAAARFRQSQQNYAALAVEIRSEVRTARNALASARERAEFYRTVVLPLRQKVVDETQLHFNAAQLGIFQLLQARQAQIDAGRESIVALRDYWVARVRLTRAVGGRLPAAASESGATPPPPEVSPHTAPPGSLPTDQPATQPAPATPAAHPHGDHS